MNHTAIPILKIWYWSSLHTNKQKGWLDGWNGRRRIRTQSLTILVLGAKMTPVDCLLNMSQRDEWMLGDDFSSILDEKQSKLNSENTLKKKDIVSERELNPLLRKQDGEKKSTTSSTQTQSIEWTSVLVKRAIKMIESGEKTFENAAVDRFGSVKAFEDAIRQVERHERIKFKIRIPQTTKPSEVRVPEPVECKPQENVNKLMAKKMKAELAGDFETSRRLEEEIANLQKQPVHKEKEKLTLLPTETYSKRKAENEMTIAELARHEKLSNSKEFDREFQRGITGNKKFKDDLDSLDDQIKLEGVKKSNNTFDCRSRSIDEYKQRERIITKECWYCPESERFKLERVSDWIVAYGNFTYLTVPKSRSIHPLHCQIVPITHTSSLLDCKEFEDEIWEEVRNFKKCLLQLAAKQDRSFVFIECVMKTGDARRHTFIDCIPTPRGQYSENVKGHFLKALEETDTEWSQHKKVIDTSHKAGGLRSALPRKHFPYFYVDFRLDQGYAHVIEDPDRFSPSGSDFGRDIMASILGVSRNEWRSTRTSREEFKVFCDKFKPFDWTEQLK